MKGCPAGPDGVAGEHGEQHTPGPWTYEEEGRDSSVDAYRVTTADHMDDLLTYSRNTRGDREEAEANARLMAAAPDLLAALRDTVDEGQHAEGCGWWNTPAIEMRHKLVRKNAEADCDCYLREARNAIANATTGREMVPGE